ncbi:glycoside hydrolase family 16 protein [Aplosporella prunicola CBS 121167]|uniref:Glycoside hydrolase family 16 protein n=1 Tax=Aplosporella prunicola CBS 121167 TaxID=1176127 RepID=A0A6A6B611_9PEZI|nr:glycoside hydrolase family 16 protein [Aplosporella prunicola CBS 121167]KAF2138694.1 glycoside hydrolase family 16 protein [Aplosporella prunicola CBS 121167]
MTRLFASAAALLSVISQLPNTASAKCECGYSLNKTTDASHEVWTDLLETDFMHADTLNSESIGWSPQEYNVTSKSARGPYGKMASLANVIANPLKNSWDWSGEGIHGGDPGMQLWARSEIVEDMVGMGEIVADRTDMLYGSFRVAMKLTAVPGTCGAFFWFRNDTQEIDMEFLSKQLNATANPVNLVLQSPQSAANGYDAANTQTYDIYPLPFKPDEAFHEYRFDWIEDRVSFYADGQWMKDMTVDLPNSPGHLTLNHWSNGDHGWSAGPPKEDALLTVSYVKAYFNSSDTDRQKDYQLRCNDTIRANESSICEIPAQLTSPDPSGSDGNNTAHTFFFSEDPEETSNQTVYSDWRDDSSAGSLHSPMGVVAVSVAFASVMALIGLV